MTDQPSNKDIMEAIQGLATHMDTQFAEMASREDLRRSEAETRDFIDRRIGDVEAQFAPKMRAIDEKDSALVDHLAKKAIIAKPIAADIQAISPFAL